MASQPAASEPGASQPTECDGFVALFRHLPDVILGWQSLPDGTQKIAFLGPAANYVGAAPTGTGPAGLTLHPEDMPRWRQAQAAACVEPWSFEGRYLTLTGATRRFDCQILPRQPDGSQLGILLDSTQRKAAETAERQVKEIRAELIALKHMASLGQLTAGIVHEIKNPLNFISNFAALSVDLLDELGEHLTENDRAQIEEVARLLGANLGKIRDHAGRVDSIIRSMLLHAHSGAGVRRPTDLNKLVDEARMLAFHGARAKDMSFKCNSETRFDPEVGLVDVVPEDLTRVVVNLMSNAFYATEKRRYAEGPAYVPVVEVATRCLDGAVEIRVDDNGIGIPESVRKHLFTPFFTTKPAGEGTGLGLSLSADIIHDHRGEIRCDSMVGGHTVFTITLPAPRKPLFEKRRLGTPEPARPN